MIAITASPLFRSAFRKLLAALVLVLATAVPALAQQKPDPAAALLLAGARRAFNEHNYTFAADRFREFLNKYGGRPEANAARYGLALSLLEGPARDYNAAIPLLQALLGVKDLPEHAHAQYYLGLSRRGLGMKELALATAKPAEANGHRNTARQRFEEASKDFAAAIIAFTERLKKADPEAKTTPIDLEWAARARCDQAEMLLRLNRAKEAQAAAEPFLKDRTLGKSRYRGLGLYYHGFASFQLKDRRAAGRSLSMLAPFTDPVHGTHARYLLARLHHADNERQEAEQNYEGVLTDYGKQKQAAAEELRTPDRFKNDPDEKARLERLMRDPPPDHVARATFFLGVMKYEDGRFADSLTRLGAFRKQFPKSPLAAEAQLREGFCQVQLKQYAEAQKTLQSLVDKEPALADQALLWIAKAQAGAANPANKQVYEQALKNALDTFRKAADRANQRISQDPEAKTRRGEILFEMADVQQLAHQNKEAAATYAGLLNDKLLPDRGEEILQHQITALHLAGDYAEADRTCQRFRTSYPKSVLLPAVLFRYAENAYFAAQAAAKKANAAERAKMLDETIARYRVVVEKYPEFAYVNLARYGLGMAYYRKGDLDKARETLTAIPAADRTGELAAVPYQLTDILLRQMPAKADDAIAAGKLEEQLKGAIELLEGFIGSQPNGPHTADALLKLGYCQQRTAKLLAQPPEQAKALAAARAAYEQILQRFGKHEVAPQAHFERAKCLAQAKDIGGAINELRRFTNDPLKSTPIAPMALLHLATLLRGQNQAAEAVKVLDECRKQHEANLQKDPARAGWVPLLQLHHGIALREAGKQSEARGLLDGIVRQAPNRPEAWEAGLRAGQCLQDDGNRKLTEGKRQREAASNNPPQRAAAQKLIDEGLKDLRDAAQYLGTQADALKTRKPASEDLQKGLDETRSRMLYESAWAARRVADEEVRAARARMTEEKWQKQRDEAAKKLPPGSTLPFVPMPVVARKAVPLQPGETLARQRYQALIDAFPDVAINADARFELAELLGERGEHDAAIKLLKEAIDKEPGPELTDKIRVRLGACLLAKGDTKAALAQIQAVADNPKSPVVAYAIYELGECLLKTGDAEQAAKRLAVFRDQGPFQNLAGLTDRGLLRLGYALGQLKQWDRSRQAYEQLVNRFGNSPWAAEARYGMGWAHQSKGEYDQAVNVYTQVANTETTELGARAQLNIGLCRLAQKRYAEASTALLVVPYTYDYPELSALALVEAARALGENKQQAQAEKLLRRVLRDHAGTKSAEIAQKRLDALMGS